MQNLSSANSLNISNPIIDDSSNRIDSESETFLKLLQEQEAIRKNRVERVRTVLVVLSSKGMVYDVEALKQKILLTYPDAAVFFRTTRGKSVGPQAPYKVDLLIDFTSPGSHQQFFTSRKLKSRARISVGRNAGVFRKFIYSRIFDEKKLKAEVPKEQLEKERFVQRKVLELAGIAVSQKGDTPRDQSHSIALELPPLMKL